MILEIPNSQIKFDIREEYETDSIVIKEIWEENVYQVSGWNFFREDTGQEVVIDIGANIGAFSILAANEGARVYAVEPESENFSALEKNISLNSMENAITPFLFGISDHRGQALISKEGGNSTIVGNSFGSLIELLTLDGFVESLGLSSIGVLKIDAEGSEVPIILGASKNTLSMCKYITLEFDIKTGNRMGEMVQKLSETHHVTTMGSWERGGMIFAKVY